MTIEDCLEAIVSFVPPRFDIDSRDVRVLHSLSTQIAKGTALTDRQHVMLKRILSGYKNQFAERDIDLDECVDNLRLPLRVIDRSKYVTIAESEIKIRFPFNKKTIVIIDKLKEQLGEHHYRHERGTHEHFFTNNERCLYFVVSRFLDKEFKIDQELLNNYDILKSMMENQEQYLPGIYDFEIKNCSPAAVEYMMNDLGKPDKDNLALYQDRSMMYGLEHLDQLAVNRSLVEYSVLAQKIAKRQAPNVFVNNEKWNVQSLISALVELDRFPLLVVLDKKKETSFEPSYGFVSGRDYSLTELMNIHSQLENLVSSSEMSAIELIQDPRNCAEFEDYVKRKNLDNPITENTKVIYTTMQLALNGFVSFDWNYSAVIFTQGCAHRAYAVKTRMKQSDLIIYHDTTFPLLMQMAEYTEV